MAQSVKLSDGSYIDASAVYDTAHNWTQKEFNERIVEGKGVTVTTSATGTAKLGLTLTDGIVLAVYPNGGYAGVPFLSGSDWYVGVYDEAASGLTPYASKTIGCRIYYFHTGA